MFKPIFQILILINILAFCLLSKFLENGPKMINKIPKQNVLLQVTKDNRRPQIGSRDIICQNRKADNNNQDNEITRQINIFESEDETHGVDQ